MSVSGHMGEGWFANGVMDGVFCLLIVEHGSRRDVQHTHTDMMGEEA